MMSSLYEDRSQAEATADKLKAFAQPQRLMILSLLLARGEQSVSEIDLATGIGQPALSQQLGELRRAGLVSTRRQSKQIYYNLTDKRAALCVRSIETAFGPADLATAELSLDLSFPRTSKRVAPGAAGFVRVLTG